MTSIGRAGARREHGDSDRRVVATVVAILAGIVAAGVVVWLAVLWILDHPAVLLVLAAILLIEGCAAGSSLLDWREGRLAQRSWLHGLWLGHATAVVRAARRARWHADGIRVARRSRRQAAARAARAATHALPCAVIDTAANEGRAA